MIADHSANVSPLKKTKEILVDWKQKRIAIETNLQTDFQYEPNECPTHVICELSEPL